MVPSLRCASGWCECNEPGLSLLEVCCIRVTDVLIQMWKQVGKAGSQSCSALTLKKSSLTSL